MAKDFFKIDKGLNLPTRTLPISPDEGDIAKDTADNKFKFYENGVWKKLGSGSGNGSGAESMDLRYRAEIQDSLSETPNGNTPIDISAGKTDVANFNAANEYFRFSYDASKTVTGTGTSMSLSAAPGFTVKLGDILVVGTEARAITALGSINSTGAGFTIESAFTTNPSAATACVSQAVYTQDLNGFTAGGTGLAISSQITTNVSSVLVNYEDSSTVNDIIPDLGVTPHIAYQVTGDNSSWSAPQVRRTNITDAAISVSVPVAGSQLRIRFFANKTSGTGLVNFLGFKAFWHEQISDAVGSTYNTAFARPTSALYNNVSHSVVGGKSRFVFSFTYGVGLNTGAPSGSALQVIVNGQMVPRFVSGLTDTTQAYFIEISDNTIEMDTDYSSAGLEFMFRVPVTVVDSNTSNTNRIFNIEGSLDQQLDAQIVASFMSPVNGTPTSGQFRSDITNRKPMVDLSSDLGIQFGGNRISASQIALIPDEFGPAGQPVFKLINDKLNQVRFVGDWTNQSSVNGVRPAVAVGNQTSYIEVVFYGTGLNLLCLFDNGSRDINVSVDGGADSADLYPNNGSAILSNRNYNTNHSITVASGLTLGIHTVKIKLNGTVSNDFNVYGFDVLTNTTSLQAKPGVAVKGKNRNAIAALSSVSFNSGFDSGTLGTRGGCVVAYAKTDGTIGKSLTPTNASSAFLTSADHTNEEVIRVYNFREFGANRTDDFSSLVTTSSTRAFTLDDNVTSLVANAVNTSALFKEGIVPTNANDYIVFTFVGTGLDLINVRNATITDTHTISVDGNNVGTGLTTALGDGKGNVVKIASGLPYGTHTVRIIRTTAVGVGLAISDFIVYGPKKPSIPSGAIELYQYYVMADYVNPATTTNWSVPTGVIRKMNTRELMYSGTWNAGTIGANYPSGWQFNTSTTGAFVELQFFGTGINYSFANNGGAQSQTVSIDGSSNLSAFTTLLTATAGLSFTAATGVITGSPAGSINHNNLSISGLTLGWHTIRVAWTSGTVLAPECFDVICPIHAPAINLPANFQNTIMVGNDYLWDLRKWSKLQVTEEMAAKVAVARAISNSPTTTSTSFIPLPDMSVTWYSDGEWVEISYNLQATQSNTGQSNVFVLYLNGLPIQDPTNGGKFMTAFATNDSKVVSDVLPLFLPKGFHKIDVYWRVNGGTGTASGLSRILTVKKLINN